MKADITYLLHPHQQQLDVHDKLFDDHRIILHSLVERVNNQAKEIERLEALVENLYDTRGIEK